MAERLQYPVSMTPYLLDADGRVLSYASSGGGDLVPVGTIDVQKRFWSSLFGLTPPFWTWDASDELNRKIAEKRGEGVVSLRAKAPWFRGGTGTLGFFGMLIPILPSTAELKLYGVIVRRRRAGDPVKHTYFKNLWAPAKPATKPPGSNPKPVAATPRTRRRPAPAGKLEPAEKLLLLAVQKPDGPSGLGQASAALVALKADANAPLDAQGRTALMIAAAENKVKLVKFLISDKLAGRGVWVDRDARDLQGRTALDHARANGHTEIVGLLQDTSPPGQE